MAVTHKAIFSRFIRGEGVLEVANAYVVPVTAIENALRIKLRDKVYEPPEQFKLDEPSAQITLAEVYGVITV